MTKRARPVLAALAAAAVFGAAACQTLDPAQAERGLERPLEASEPQPGLWVRYGTMWATSDGRRVADHFGWPFSVRLNQGRAGWLEAELRFPRFSNLRHHLVAAAAASRPGAGSREAVRLDHDLLSVALDLHRPPFRLRVSPAGEVTIEQPRGLQAFERCESRLLHASFERLIAGETDEARRRSWRAQRDNPRRLGPEALDEPQLLVRLLALDLPSAGGGVGQAGPRQAPGLAHVREALLRVDLLRDPPSPAASLCRTVEVGDVGEIQSDVCTFRAAFDTRTGWPRSANIARRVEGSGDRRFTRDIFFDRNPREETLPVAANPCPA